MDLKKRALELATQAKILNHLSDLSNSGIEFSDNDLMKILDELKSDIKKESE